MSTATEKHWTVKPTFWARRTESEPREIESWSVLGDNFFIQNIKTESNARLIAAAPAMLEALQAALLAIRTQTCTDQILAEKKAISAIRLAKGEL